MQIARQPGLAVVWAALLFVGRALADEQEHASEPVESAREAATPSPIPRAALVIVTGAPARELEDLFSELLARDGVALALERRSEFNPHEVLSPNGAGSGVRVFIDLRDPNFVRLYFRSPDGERFLVRNLVLPSGTDDLGREQLGQVVESSTLALLHSQAGLSREQAESVIEAARPEPVRPPLPAKPRAVEPSQAAPVPRRSALRGEVALRYAFEAQGDALALRHGPGFEVAVGQSVFGLRVTYEHGFAQAVHVPEFNATEQAESVRLAGELGLRVAARQRAALTLGGGIDVAHFDPGASRDPAVTPSDPHTHVTPVLRAELRYELAFEPVLLTAAALLDVACQRTHYDVIDGGSVHRAATLNTVRPGGAIALAFRFGL